MNLGTGVLMLLGFLLLLAGTVSKIAGVPLLEPIIVSGTGYFVAGNTCFLMALIVDKFHKRQ